MRGDGSIYRSGKVWYGNYAAGGRRIRVSLGTEDEKLARRKLQRLRRQADRGELLLPEVRRVTVSELLNDLLTHLEVRRAASRGKVASHVKELRKTFGAWHAHQLETAAVERYQKARLAAGRAPATVNRECEALRQAFNLAARRTPAKVRAVPHIPLLKVENARQGFLSSTDVKKLLAGLVDPDVRDFVEWFWWTGMRPNEIRQLTWEMYDRETAALTLAPHAEKARKGRVIPVVGPLAEIMKRRLARRALGCELIFHRTSKGKYRVPVKDFRLQWKAALKKAGLSKKLLPYDLRRTALRNMIRSGVDFTVAMKISGHRTRATFDRYNIVSQDDLESAIGRTANYVGNIQSDNSVQSRASELRQKRSRRGRK
jgi:integrase